MSTSERTHAQQVGDAIDAYDDFCADGIDRETARIQAVEMILRIFAAKKMDLPEAEMEY